jgi:thiol-disulfide isomerase/thioredoxin
MSTAEDWAAATKINYLSAPSAAGAVETCTVIGLEPNRAYYAALRVVADNGSISDFSQQIRIITSDTSMPLAFTAPDIYGTTHSSTEWLGKRLVLINFWGVWCAYCVQEMPDLIRVHGEFTDDGLVMVGFNVGDLPETAQQFAEKMSLPWLNIDVPNEVVGDFGVHGYPTTVFLDSTGRELGRLNGKQSYDTFSRAVQYLLNDTA